MLLNFNVLNAGVLKGALNTSGSGFLRSGKFHMKFNTDQKRALVPIALMWAFVAWAAWVVLL
jgi:hypothetical protein